MSANGVIQRKLALMDEYLVKLDQQLQAKDLAAFQDDWVLRRFTERCLQVMIEAMIDVAERLVALRRAGPVASAGEAIERLVDLGILRSPQPYRDMIGFRNLLVHMYEEIDVDILFRLGTTRQTDFRAFRDEIDRYLSAQESDTPS